MATITIRSREFIGFLLQNGKALPSSGYLIVNEAQQVHVEEASEKDEGNYVCTAENPAGRVQKDIAVSMLSELTYTITSSIMTIIMLS